MSKQSAPLEHIRIASPCAISWDSMSGGERVRHCRECGLNVYDLSALTRREAEELISSTEGRLCARLHRRADGTVLTTDCPVGWRAVRARATMKAGAALAALLSLFGAAVAQNSSQKKKQQEQCRDQITVRRDRFEPAPPQARAPLTGTILDPAGAVVPGATVTLTDAATKGRRAETSDGNGVFSFASLPAGVYELAVASPGFKELKVPKLALERGEAITLDVTLEIYGEVMVGIIAMDDPRERLLKIEGITIRYEE